MFHIEFETIRVFQKWDKEIDMSDIDFIPEFTEPDPDAPALPQQEEKASEFWIDCETENQRVFLASDFTESTREPLGLALGIDKIPSPQLSCPPVLNVVNQIKQRIVETIHGKSIGHHNPNDKNNHNHV